MGCTRIAGSDYPMDTKFIQSPNLMQFRIKFRTLKVLNLYSRRKKDASNGHG